MLLLFISICAVILFLQELYLIFYSGNCIILSQSARSFSDPIREDQKENKLDTSIKTKGNRLSILKQRNAPTGDISTISNSGGSPALSVTKAHRNVWQRRSVIMNNSPSFRRKKLANVQILSAKIATSEASKLNRYHSDLSKCPSSRRSAYGIRSTVPAPLPRHRLSNKRICCTQKDNWLTNTHRPSLYIQNRTTVRGFNSRFIIATPGVNRGHQVRSFIKYPLVKLSKAGEQSCE